MIRKEKSLDSDMTFQTSCLKGKRDLIRDWKSTFESGKNICTSTMKKHFEPCDRIYWAYLLERVREKTVPRGLQVLVDAVHICLWL